MAGNVRQLSSRDVLPTKVRTMASPYRWYGATALQSAGSTGANPLVVVTETLQARGKDV